MKYALLTGAGGGLGYATLKALHNEGYYIFALDLAQPLSKIEPENNIQAIATDITREEDIIQAFAIISSITDHLEVVINLAGIVTIGPVIELPVDELRRIMETNLYGNYMINKAAFPLVLKGKGRYINVSSEYGRLGAVPFHSLYTMSKHALEVYNDALRRELLPFDIKVIMLRPGAFSTPMQQSVMKKFDQLLKDTKRYGKPLRRMKKIMVDELKLACDPRIFTKTLTKSVHSLHPRQYYNIRHSLKMRLLSILPSALQDFIFNQFLE